MLKADGRVFDPKTIKTVPFSTNFDCLVLYCADWVFMH